MGEHSLWICKSCLAPSRNRLQAEPCRRMLRCDRLRPVKWCVKVSRVLCRLSPFVSLNQKLAVGVVGMWARRPLMYPSTSFSGKQRRAACGRPCRRKRPRLQRQAAGSSLIPANLSRRRIALLQRPTLPGERMTFKRRGSVIVVPQAPLCPKIAPLQLRDPASPVDQAAHACLATRTSPVFPVHSRRPRRSWLAEPDNDRIGARAAKLLRERFIHRVCGLRAPPSAPRHNRPTSFVYDIPPLPGKRFAGIARTLPARFRSQARPLGE
jgi:hypothetical protein